MGKVSKIKQPKIRTVSGNSYLWVKTICAGGEGESEIKKGNRPPLIHKRYRPPYASLFGYQTVI